MNDAQKKRAERILSKLIEVHGSDPWNWHTRQDAFQILIGTVLSQRTRDEKTDQAARALFSKYSSPRQIAHASPMTLENIIRPVNYYKTKAQRIKEICQVLIHKYAGEVPETFEELVMLPGVGRKTANCVLIYGFRKSAIAVDTHVHRISNRLGLIQTKTPIESEHELLKVIPEPYIRCVNEIMVKHGQTICRPIRPLCQQCPVITLCAHSLKTEVRK